MRAAVTPKQLPEVADVLSEKYLAATATLIPVVMGELATGDLARRENTLAALRQLPRSTAGTTDECVAFIETYKLYGRGIGWGDLQLLVSSRLSGNLLWSLDKRLAAAALQLDVAYVAR